MNSEGWLGWIVIFHYSKLARINEASLQNFAQWIGLQRRQSYWLNWLNRHWMGWIEVNISQSVYNNYTGSQRKSFTNCCGGSNEKNDADLYNVELLVERRRTRSSGRTQGVADVSLCSLMFQPVLLLRLARPRHRARRLALGGRQEREGGGVDGSVERWQSEGNILR